MCRVKAFRAFTLIEIMAALVIFGLIASFAVVSLAGQARAVRLADQVEQVKAFDRAVRERARRNGTTPALTFDLRAGTVRAGSRDLPPLRLGDRFRLAAVMLPGERVEFGDITLPVSADGRSSSYAVHVTDAEMGDPAGGRWVLVMGLTGQTIELENEQEVQDIFTTLLSPN
jgi:prepilin-type N-terminal cleavage/methylation domain-containing protein